MCDSNRNQGTLFSDGDIGFHLIQLSVEGSHDPSIMALTSRLHSFALTVFNEALHQCSFMVILNCAFLPCSLCFSTSNRVGDGFNVYLSPL